MDNTSPGALVALGIIVGLLSTCVQSVGLTMQRKSHMLEDGKEDLQTRRPPYRRRRWQIGMFLFLIANIIGSSIQITTLPLPLLSTLQASGLVFNSLLASLLLKEPWTWRTGYGTMLVAAGALLISFFSALPEPSHNLKQLLQLLHAPAFQVWFSMSLVFVLAVLVTDFSLRKCISAQRAESPRIHLIRGMSYGLVSGILSAHALLLAKSAVELIVRSIADKTNQFTGYQSWLLILAFLVLALSQLYYLHLGLKLISTSILYPFVFCIYNIVAILDGLIYFRQMDRLPVLHAWLIALGTVILLAGVLALSWRLQDEEDPDHPEMAHAEIPQTLLTPGLGFAADPDDDTNESAVASEDDFESDEESSALLSRSRTSLSRMDGRTRRRRAQTLKEVSQIWQELGDEEEAEAQYGTFKSSARTHSVGGRPASAGHQRQRERRRSSGGRNLDEPPDISNLARAKTMPSQRRSVSGKRRSTSGKRRKVSGHHDGALFSDLLRKDWWRTRPKDDDDDDNDERPATERSGGANEGREAGGL